jgi:hypothetical protein
MSPQEFGKFVSASSGLAPARGSISRATVPSSARLQPEELPVAFAVVEEMRRRGLQYADLNERGQRLVRLLSDRLKSQGYESYRDYVKDRGAVVGEWVEGGDGVVVPLVSLTVLHAVSLAGIGVGLLVWQRLR